MHSMEKGVQALAVNSFREDEEQKVVLNRNTIKRLFSYLMGYKKTIVIVLLLIGVTTAVALVNPLMIERAINVHIKNGDSKGLMLLSLFACILNIIFLYAMRKRITLMEDISTEIVENIRYKCMFTFKNCPCTFLIADQLEKFCLELQVM